MGDLKKFIFIPITFLLVLIVTVGAFLHLFRYEFIVGQDASGIQTIIRYDKFRDTQCMVAHRLSEKQMLKDNINKKVFNNIKKCEPSKW